MTPELLDRGLPAETEEQVMGKPKRNVTRLGNEVVGWQIDLGVQEVLLLDVGVKDLCPVALADDQTSVGHPGQRRADEHRTGRLGFERQPSRELDHVREVTRAVSSSQTTQFPRLYRVKDPERLRGKLRKYRKDYDPDDEVVGRLKDLAGVRIATYVEKPGDRSPRPTVLPARSLPVHYCA